VGERIGHPACARGSTSSERRGAISATPTYGRRGIAGSAALRNTKRTLLLALIVFPIVWVLFIASGTSFGPAVSDPKDFFITLLNGLTAAALYFVVASGFTLVFGLMRVVNMAHGAFFLLGGYIALRVQRNMVGVGSEVGLSSAQVSFTQWIVPTIVAVAIIAAAGLIMQQLLLRWNQGQDLRQALITIAVSIILADQMLAHFGGVPKDISWPGTFDKFVDLKIYDTQYTLTRLIILGIGLAVGLALWYWLKRTRTGMVIRAGVDDRDMVSATGINIQLTFAIAFAVGSGLAGLGGAIGGSFSSLAPGVDANWLLNSLIVVIIGGMGSLGGAAIGALLLGMVTNFTAAYLPADYTFYSIIFTFILLAIVLAIRPLGLFGRPA
jgi:branched-chain amino acid transport system permease protein